MAGAKRRFAVCLSLLVGVPSGLVAHAQDGTSAPVPAPGAVDAAVPSTTTPSAPVIVAPKVKEFAQATFPPDALAQGLSGRVEVELVVGADGHVSNPQIKTPAGHGFDEAALEAAQRLTFEPATRDGVPIAARIVFPYVFEFKAPEPPPPEEAPPVLAKLEGHVLEAKTSQPIADVEIILSSADHRLTQRLVTAADGGFGLDGLPAGVYQLRLTKKEWRSQETTETLAAGEVTSLVYRLVAAEDGDTFHAVARVAPPARELTRRTIDKEELARIPGTRGDALRTVELLPGVARPPFGVGLLIVRGSAPADTQVLLDGIPVQQLYHFGGLTSFINTRMLEDVQFFPGNFSVRYGRRRGGIVEATLAEPSRDELHGVIDLNLIDGSIYAEGPITDDWAFAAAARRSWIDLVLGTALSSSDISTIAAPVYYDYQALTTYRPSENDRLRLLVYGSSDNFKLLFQQPSDQDPTLSGDFKFSTQFHRAHASWSSKISDRVDHDLEIAAGVLSVDFGVGNAFNFTQRGEEVYARSEWKARVTDHVRLIAGLDLAFLPGELTYDGPPPAQQEGNPSNGNTASNRSKVSTSDKYTIFQPAMYLESDLDLGQWRVVMGSRIDYFSEIQKYSFDPRLAVIYALTEDFHLKGGFGLFSQPPQPQESLVGLGNPHLGPTHTIHVGGGFEEQLVPGVKISIEGFYKHLYDTVIGTDYGLAPQFINGGKGRIYGLEVQAKIEPKGPFFGNLSYTLSRSERDDHNTGYRLFDFDQPHILAVTGVYRLGHGWEAGLTFRLISGNLSTPVIGALYNKDTALYSPVYGPVNSLRTPYFHRLDVRVEKKFTFQTWKLAVYLDVQNVYNATNQEGITYDFEYHQMTPISGLPILPNLGVRGEL